MSDTNAVELLKRGDARFSARQQLDSFRDEVARHFCPWHASFMSPLQWGEDFASHLLDGTPLLLARDFKAQVGSMLRPAGKQWFWDRTHDDDLNNDRAVRDYLDWRSRQKMRILFDRSTGAHRAFTMADEFFAYFGDAVISIDLNATMDQLRVKSYHVKECVWALGDDGKANVLTRKEEIPARNMIARFRQPGDKVHHKVREAYDKNPDQIIPIRHEVIPADEYDAYRKTPKSKARFVSVWIDEDNKCVIREREQSTFRYVVASWVRLPHTPYAISPATTIALPDARLIQQQALAIMDAAEKAANPPLVATSDAIRGAIDLKPNGVTWIDRSYDERTGDPLRPLAMGKNVGIGAEALMRTERQITRAFYLDILRMPDTRNSKSTLEVQFHIDEYVRAALPLFAPMQSDYNEAVLEEVDAVLDHIGYFDPDEAPDELRDQGIVYQWDNPLAEMIERQRAQQAAELSTLGQAWAALEAAAAQSPTLKQINVEKGFRESAISIGAARWLLDESEAKRSVQAGMQANAQQSALMQAKEMAPLIDSGVNAAQAASEIPVASEPGYPLMPAPV